MSKFYKLLRNKTFVYAGIVFLLLMSVLEFRQWRLRANVQKEISDLNNQAEQIQKSNAELESFVSYLKTDSYKEKAAREQLSMKKDGEVVYSFTNQAPAAAESASAQAGDAANPKPPQNNIGKWWQYFFKGN